MRLVVLGAGGIGAYYGAGFAKGGADVTLVARGAHLAAIRDHGLTVTTPETTERHELRATDDPAEVGPVDVVLFCVKSYDTDSAVALLPPILEPDTAVVSLQNGIDNEARIAAAIGWRHVLGGAAYIFAAVTAPGVVVAQWAAQHRVRGMGRGDRRRRGSGASSTSARAGGVGATASPDVQVVKWEKYVLLAALSAVSAATQLPLGDIRRSPAATTLLRDLMAEVCAVGRASGVALDDDLVDRQHRLVLSQADDSRASLQTDLVGGHRMEIDALQGATVRLGLELGVPTPQMTAVYAILEPWAIRNAARDGARS